jgi:hypothetical protein
MARADDDTSPGAGPIPGTGQIELLDPGDSRTLTRTFRLKRPPASAPGLAPAPAPPGEPTTRFFSRAELLGRAQGLAESRPTSLEPAPFVPVLAPPRLASEAAPPFAAPPSPVLLRPLDGPLPGHEPRPAAIERSAAVPELARSSTDESPVELPCFHRLPFFFRSRRARVGMVKGIAAVAALAVGGWMVLRPIPTTARAIPSASAAVPARATAAELQRTTVPQPSLPVPAAIGVPTNPNATPRGAADAVAEGRYADALALYRSLAAAEPGQNAYRDAARILEERLAPP